MMKVISFDIEATDRGEMLELSVCSWPEQREVYHSYYKPEKSREWKTTERIHHITPAMVADAPRFNAERSVVQRLIDDCDMIVGFAINNDLRYLSAAGIRIPRRKQVLDVRDLFWVAKGKECGLEFGNVPSLSKCAALAGMDFSEEEDAHSATNDTLATLELFGRLLDCYNDGCLDGDLCRRVEKRIEADRELVMEENAKGMIRLQPCPGGFRIKNNRLIEGEYSPSEGEYAITVKSRYLAEHDIRAMFERRADKQRPSVYNLRQTDIDRFMAYTNTYNAVQEMIYRNRYGYRRSKNNLDFEVR